MPGIPGLTAGGNIAPSATSGVGPTSTGSKTINVGSPPNPFCLKITNPATLIIGAVVVVVLLAVAKKLR